MKRLLKRFGIRMLLLNTLVLFSISGFSTKYYVDVAGNNSNNGSSSSPWKTLNYACTAVTTPGDIIHLNGGTFNESSRSNLAVGVSIEGSGIDVTVINSSYAASNSSDGAILLNSSTYTSGNQTISNLTFTGNNLTATRGICINYRNNVSINNCKLANFYASAVFFRGSDVAWDAEPNPYCTGNKIFNTTINSCATRSSGESASIRINGQSGFQLYNNTLTQTFRPAGQNGNILGGEWNKELKIYNNTFTKPDNEGSAWNFFFELWHWQGGGEIYNNTFNGAATMDIVDVVKSSSDYGLKIHDNKYLVKAIVPFTANQIQAINLEGRSHLNDIEIYNNYMKNVPNGIWVDVVVNEGEGYSSFDVSNLLIHHNVMENVGMTDVNTIPIWMDAYGGNGNISFNNIQINNNSIQCSNNVKGDNAIKWNVIGKFSNIFIQNNILTNNENDVMSFSSSLSGATLTNVTIKNNLYYNNGANAPKYNITVSNKVENSNNVANPLFVSSTDLNLQSGSPAINAGVNIGYPFNGTAPDLGAYETGSKGATVDATKPVISSFTIPSSSGSLTVPISTFTASDNIGVTGYLLSQTSNTPSVSSSAWRSRKPTSYTFSSSGIKTLYAWVKDASGNISSPLSSGITITLNLLTVKPDASQQNMHFSSVSQVNSSDGMNIELTGIKEGVLGAGDELAVFDGNTCVSSIKLLASDLSNGYVRLIAPVGSNNQDGFTNGNAIQIMSWNAKSGVESQQQAEATNGKMVFEAQSNAVIQLKFQTTGVADIIKSVKIDVYPNPCTDHMTVRYSEVPANGSRIEIIDNAGKVVDSREITNAQESFNLNQMPNGLYLVKSKIGSGEVVNKLIINK